MQLIEFLYFDENDHYNVTPMNSSVLVLKPVQNKQFKNRNKHSKILFANRSQQIIL